MGNSCTTRLLWNVIVKHTLTRSWSWRMDTLFVASLSLFSILFDIFVSSVFWSRSLFRVFVLSSSLFVIFYFLHFSFLTYYSHFLSHSISFTSLLIPAVFYSFCFHISFIYFTFIPVFFSNIFQLMFNVLICMCFSCLLSTRSERKANLLVDVFSYRSHELVFVRNVCVQMSQVRVSEIS
jgi:hypothetical protein